MEKTLVVIDGNSLINRGYYAIQRPMITKEGIYTQGIYAFLSMLGKIRADYKPTHMLVAFDRKAPTFRHQEYSEYKAGRKGMPIELAMEMPILKDILDAMGIPRFEIDGFEADDILGTATLIAEEQGVHSYIISGDRDTLQLATDLTSVIINKKGMTDFKLYDDAAMIEEYGFNHIQFIDYKALRGDTSDNIPGIPGVGEKTATKLIQEYGSLENLIANVDNISNAKLRAKIEDGAMSAMFSKRLATIVRTVPLEMEFEDFAIKPQNTKALVDLYTKLEFKKYLSDLLSQKDEVIEEDKAALSSDFDYPEVITISDYEEGLKLLEGMDEIFIDFSSDNNHISKPCALSFNVYDKDKFYALNVADLNKFILEAFDKKTKKISGYSCHNFFYYLLANDCDCKNIELSYDANIASYILNPSSKEKSLDVLLLEYFHVKLDENEGQLSLFDLAGNYENSCKKLYLLYKLSLIHEEEIKKFDLETVYKDIDLPLCKVLAAMEANGFRTDAEGLKEFGKELKVHIKELESEIHKLAGEEFNINSPKQLGVILFEKLGLPSEKKTKTGYSTNAEVLEKLAEDYPIVAKILEYRTYAKLNSTYVEGMLPLIGSDNKIHPHFEQTVTATGRISCTEPNLQNIPIRTDLGRQLRRVFTASSDKHVLIGADYSQIELRVMASMSGDNTMITAFNEGHDIHRETASKVFNIPLEEVTPIQRSNAKAVNFGVIYGMSQFGLSNELTISVAEANRYIKDYFERFKDVKAFLDKCIDDCKKTGEIRTKYGRRRVIPEINASKFMVRQLGERLAMNTPIQGTAADIIKIAMIRVYNRLLDEVPSAKLILQIHDELIVDCPLDAEERVTNILKECMESACEMAVKLIAEPSSSYNWYDLK